MAGGCPLAPRGKPEREEGLAGMSVQALPCPGPGGRLGSMAPSYLEAQVAPVQKQQPAQGPTCPVQLRG